MSQVKAQENNLSGRMLEKGSRRLGSTLIRSLLWKGLRDFHFCLECILWAWDSRYLTSPKPTAFQLFVHITMTRGLEEKTKQEAFSFDFWADVTPVLHPQPKTGLYPMALRLPTWPSFCYDLWVPCSPLRCCSFSSFPASSWYHWWEQIQWFTL